MKQAVAVGLMALVLSGCALFGGGQRTTLRIHEQVMGNLPDQQSILVDLPKYELRIRVSPYATVTEAEVLAAELFDTAGGNAVLLRFDRHGAIKLEEASLRQRGRYLVVFLNQKATAAWLVREPLRNGQFLLEGDFTDEEAKKLVDDLNRQAKKRLGFGSIGESY